MCVKVAGDVARRVFLLTETETARKKHHQRYNLLPTRLLLYMPRDAFIKIADGGSPDEGRQAPSPARPVDVPESLSPSHCPVE